MDQASFLDGADVTWVVDAGVGFLPRLAEPSRNFITLSLKESWKSFRRLKDLLTKEKPQRVILFYAPWWASVAAWLARVPIRAGRLSQWHSYLFLNRGLRQSRSESAKHEAQYNWELLHFAYDQKFPQVEPPFLKVQAGLKRQLFEKFDLRSKSYVVVHPGMSGSALNWPQEKYNELIEKLILDTTVVITGTPTDGPWLTEILPRWKGHPQVRVVVGELGIEELLFILQSAKCVIAPSTGVLHLGAATGTPVVGIYSPVQSQHPRRWGPRGFGAQALLPNVNCPAKIKCWKEKCPHYLCMEKISIEDVLEKVIL